MDAVTELARVWERHKARFCTNCGTELDAATCDLCDECAQDHHWPCAICERPTPVDEGPLCEACRAIEADTDAELDDQRHLVPLGV